MSKANLIYQAKAKGIELSRKFILMEDHGMNTDCVAANIRSIKMFVLTLERYNDTSDPITYSNDILYLNGKKIILSEKNNYFCNNEDQEEQTINVKDIYTNCITEEEVCRAARELQCIINN